MKNNLPDLEDTDYKINKANALLNYVTDDLADLSDAVKSGNDDAVATHVSNMDHRTFLTCMSALDLIEEIQKDVEACIKPIDEVSGRASN